MSRRPTRRSLVLLALLFLASVPFAVGPSPTWAGDRNGDVDGEGDHVYDPALFQTLRWRNIGPFRGGRSTAVAGVVQDPQTYYMGGVGGGIYKTTDAGQNWHNVSDGQLATGSVGALAVAPSDPNVVWAGMGESCARGVMTTHGDGVYRSTDAGRTWTHAGLADSRHISEIEVHPHDPGIAWVGVQGHLWGPNEERGVYKTTDGGATWTRVLFVDQDTGVSDLALDASNPRILYAATWQHRRTPWKIESGGPGSGIHKSTDGGATWQKLAGGLPESMGKIGVTVSPADPDRLWAIIEAELEEGGLYRSDDAGATWMRVNGDRPLWTRSWYYMHVFAHPTDADTVWVLNAPAFRSIDGGRTFERVATPHGDNHDLWIHPTQPRFMVEANDGGANVSTNGGATWSAQDNQATAQFYRVATDDLFPYNVYGGQQDNSAIVIQSRSFDAGISERHWRDIGGCESADPAFDRDDPRYVYAGCYQGAIDEWNRATGQNRAIDAWPTMMLARTPAEMRYRFNWNAPVLVSRHDPAVIYHAGNVVLRSSDRGSSWTEASPDLTRDEDEHQQDGGGPFTNEGAGGEVYGTLLAFAESPRDPQVLWAGSDDGLVHVTRDGGASWSDVSPRTAPSMINTIEISPHREGKVYLAVTSYKWDDLTPEIYRTDDWGATWTDLAGDLPADTIVRAVREDPTREGLLYAGTERGVFVSWDDGKRWQKLEQGLPTVPVTDLEVRDADLVAATHGRSFWILDDLTPIRTLSEQLAGIDLWTHQPQPAHLVAAPPPWRETPPHRGTNPPSGLVVRYLVGAEEGEAHEADEAMEAAEENEGEEEKPDPLVIEIHDEAGHLIRRVASDDETQGQTGPKPPSVAPGLQTWIWDLRWQAPQALAEEGVATFPGAVGPEVGPGTYRVTIHHGDRSSGVRAEVHADPRSGLAPDDYTERQQLVQTLRERMHTLYDTANRLADAKSQVETWLERLEDWEPAPQEEPATAEPEGSELTETDPKAAIQEAGEKLIEAIDEVDGDLVQRKTTGFQDVINFHNRLDADYGAVLAIVGGSPPPVNQAAHQVVEELDARWNDLESRAVEILGAELQAFEQMLREHGVGYLVVPAPEPSMPEEWSAGE